MSVANTPIIVSAPPGGLGRHLAALIDYAVNAQAEMPNFNRRITHTTNNQTIPEFVTPTAHARSPLQFWDWDYDHLNRIPVLYTTQSPADVAKDYPDARIIQVTTSATDSLQLGYNYIVIEQWRAIGDILEQYHSNIVKNILSDEDIVWTDIFSDPQFIDNAAVQLLIGSVGSSHLVDASASAPRADLHVEFSSICQPANTAGEASIKPVLDYLGKIARPAEDVNKVWFSFIRSLHNAKRNILNTANWS